MSWGLGVPGGASRCGHGESDAWGRGRAPGWPARAAHTEASFLTPGCGRPLPEGPGRVVSSCSPFISERGLLVLEKPPDRPFHCGGKPTEVLQEPSGTQSPGAQARRERLRLHPSLVSCSRFEQLVEGAVSVSQTRREPRQAAPGGRGRQRACRPECRVIYRKVIRFLLIFVFGAAFRSCS